jgi:hypothetical protein
MLAPTDGTASGHEGCKKPKGIPINESALRDVEAAAIGQQVLAFEAPPTAASTRPLIAVLAARHAFPASYSPEDTAPLNPARELWITQGSQCRLPQHRTVQCADVSSWPRASVADIGPARQLSSVRRTGKGDDHVI